MVNATKNNSDFLYTVSYTHLTLPTIERRRVDLGGSRFIQKKKKKKKNNRKQEKIKKIKKRHKKKKRK
ncbi:hypothetical protein, partial [Escherichia coli]|uniref:hypothetical protein n=1 Tax=Escherichia coli TaxID=562 RepID=UPI001BC88617